MVYIENLCGNYASSASNILGPVLPLIVRVSDGNHIAVTFNSNESVADLPLTVELDIDILADGYSPTNLFLIYGVNGVFDHSVPIIKNSDGKYIIDIEDDGSYEDGDILQFYIQGDYTYLRNGSYYYAVKIKGISREDGYAVMNNMAALNSDEICTILYTIESPSSVKIAVYNVRGEVIRLLQDEHEFQAGEYQVNWDFRTESGTYVSRGIYYIYLFTDDEKRFFPCMVK